MRVTKQVAAENRRRILTAAARLFREQGIDGAGVDAITEAAGLRTAPSTASSTRRGRSSQRPCASYSTSRAISGRATRAAKTRVTP